jgi:hypothetical protein
LTQTDEPLTELLLLEEQECVTPGMDEPPGISFMYLPELDRADAKARLEEYLRSYTQSSALCSDGL